MHPVRPKMKKLLLAGFVACTDANTASLPASSHSPAAANGSTTTTSPPSSSPSPSSTTSPSTSTSTPTSPRESPTASTAPPTPPMHPRPSSSSFSIGLSLGQLDYAAAGIARRVSRVFVKRMSAGSSRSMGSVGSSRGWRNSGSSRGGQGVQGEGLGRGEEGDRTAIPPPAPNLVPVVETAWTGEEVKEGVDTDDADGERAAPDIRACRWGCI
ncbi:hypothetical protein F5876DRAFT_65479 [Lentinula aff. lateritia]|uniref:Uncharacterized protein n=1 Tax=Lentinula aff. lateritia TaxID=2804960 RepID=A0ACC1U0X7_9AGAR|nr:hypothetical protein F5876DRAFT_65479 [Lentinula aff. lateritia]